MTDSFKDVIFRYGSVAIAVAILVAGAIVIIPTYRDIQKLKEREADFVARIERKNREVAELRKKQRRFETDVDFIETIARQNNRVYPGEYVFIFED